MRRSIVLTFFAITVRSICQLYNNTGNFQTEETKYNRPPLRNGRGVPPLKERLEGFCILTQNTLFRHLNMVSYRLGITRNQILKIAIFGVQIQNPVFSPSEEGFWHMDLGHHHLETCLAGNVAPCTLSGTEEPSSSFPGEGPRRREEYRLSGGDLLYRTPPNALSTACLVFSAVWPL